MRSYIVVDGSPTDPIPIEATVEVLSPYLEEDPLVKVVHCIKHYGAALLRSGRLVLLAPEVPERHGGLVENGECEVQDVAAGDTHIAFCKRDGTLYTFGYGNKHGQLGDGTVWISLPPEADARVGGPPKLSTPKMINGFGPWKEGIENGDICEGRRKDVPVTMVACGAYHTLVMTSQRNAVYGCGLGLSGQLGGKRRLPVQPIFKCIRLIFGLPLKYVTAAGKHTFVLLQTGKLLAFGDNTCGQLGLGSTKAVDTPTVVTFATTLSTVPSKGKRHTIDSYTLKALRSSWGSAESMYFPLRVERISPDLDPNEPRVKSVWCSANRTVVLTETMELLSCGLTISRSPCNGRDDLYLRMDRYGPLGRWIKNKKESTRFARMQWSDKVAEALKSVFSRAQVGGASDCNFFDEVGLVCSNHLVALLVPGSGNNNTLLFVQGDKRGVKLVSNGEQRTLTAAEQSEKLLQDRDVDDDSLVYTLTEARAFMASENAVMVI
ncbi:putative Regulator of chromosome condensation (RCC1) repeat [Trypanosoma vivax]|uniref:Chromatin binding protein, putative n=1 Tax=Trypanosoma vivax (strain Y486) TaxID=1055687 RepID=F9WUJ0_TRYVY|nr:putative chromatin binding protein [Trypanosoma vivax]KAH8611932.1 putative Regulator of chromosome condensation (RCC1) repeat [Trypanosoma vivax]CCD21239.1 chromatin binding protein, putative [Trypanosoma vivax Y486]|eukprot:CCD21239.1 chromatin binding protein, putative [Trypanosoma vivax Y486]